MPHEKLARRKSVNDLPREKDVQGEKEPMRGVLRRAQSFDEGQRHLLPPPQENAPPGLERNAPQEMKEQEQDIGPMDLHGGGEPQVLPELPLDLEDDNHVEEGNGDVPEIPPQEEVPQQQQQQQVPRDPFADKPPAQNPQQGYSHVHISSANVKMPLGRFDKRSKDEYDKIKQELELKKGRSVKDREVRYAMIKRRVQTASQARAQSGGDETLGIFTAPEGMLGDNLTKKDVNWYRRKFSKLSENNPHMAIMPGTMAWQERRRREGKKLGKETVLRTTGDVFHGGERVHSVDKRDDGGDTTGVRGQHLLGKRAVSQERAAKWYRRGKDGGTTFDIGGVNMAYEICQDHSTKRARQELHDKGEGGRDVHILNSMGNIVDGRHLALREGGIGIGSDGDRGDTTLVRAQEDWDPQDQTPVHNPSNNKNVPAYLGKAIQAPQRITPLPRTEFDSQKNPYEREQLGRFRLPGR